MSSSDRVASSSSYQEHEECPQGKETQFLLSNTKKAAAINICLLDAFYLRPGAVSVPRPVPNLWLIADGSPLCLRRGRGLWLFLEVGTQRQDTLLSEHSLCSALTRLLGAQCLEPALQGTQLLCGHNKKSKHKDHDWAGRSGPPPSGGFSALVPVTLAIFSKGFPIKLHLEEKTQHPTVPQPCAEHSGLEMKWYVRFSPGR